MVNSNLNQFLTPQIPTPRGLQKFETETGSIDLSLYFKNIKEALESFRHLYAFGLETAERLDYYLAHFHYTVHLRGLAESRVQTAAYIETILKAMEAYKVYCASVGDLRRAELLEAKYLLPLEGGQTLSTQDLAERFNCGQHTVQRSLQKATEELSLRLFGLKKKKTS